MPLVEKPGPFLLWLRNVLSLWLQQRFFSWKSQAFPSHRNVIRSLEGIQSLTRKMWGVGGWTPPGNFTSVFSGRMSWGDMAPHIPSGPESASYVGWPPHPADAPSPSPAQPSPCRSAPRTAHVPSPPQTAGGSAFPGIPAPGVCTAHTEYVMLGPKDTA